MNPERRPPATPSQTVGPFFSLGLMPSERQAELRSLISNQIRGAGEAIAITGRVFDGSGEAVGDALVEITQADGDGRLDNDAFFGFARADTGVDAGHRFRFKTVKPGPLRAGEAPYISVVVFMRGLLLHARTRIYFDDEPANRHDAVFSSLPEDRRGTLLARREGSADYAVYRFDIHMRGERETVFFQLPDSPGG